MARLIAVCGGKGSPGVTTACVALAARWPTRAVLVEADVSGGDLAVLLTGPDGAALSPNRDLLTLIAEARHHAHPALVVAHAQPTSVGVVVVQGLANADQQAALGPVWPALAAALRASHVDVIADVGRVWAGHAATPVLGQADRIVLVTRTDVASLSRLRDRVGQLGAAGVAAWRLAVLVVGVRAGEGEAVARVLAHAGQPQVEVVGVLPLSSREVARLYAGTVRPKSPLARAAAAAATALTVAHRAEPAAGEQPPVAWTGEGAAWTTSV